MSARTWTGPDAPSSEIAAGYPPRLADLARVAVKLLGEYDAVRGVAVDAGDRVADVEPDVFERAAWHVRQHCSRIMVAFDAIDVAMPGHLRTVWYRRARLVAAGVVEDGWSVELAALADAICDGCGLRASQHNDEDRADCAAVLAGIAEDEAEEHRALDMATAADQRLDEERSDP